jgi:sterol desaturase/sphingolipid hydroxylase (fatty acid hydroxylase superfamily)
MMDNRAYHKRTLPTHGRETMGKHFVSNKDESVRMFRSEALERFTHVHPAVPHLIYVPLVLLLLWVSSVPGGTAGLLFLGGLLLWTLVEYVLHRFLFHAPEAVMRGTHDIVAGVESEEAVIPKLPDFRHLAYFLMHGVHHEYPSDSKRLVMAPAISIPLAVIFWLLFRAVLGPAVAPATFAGFLVGYLIYDTTHYAVHHRSVPTAFGKLLRKHHHRHHFANPDEDYGVSSPLWDILFGTFSGGSKRAQLHR